MADDHGTTRVHLERILKRAQGFDVEVIGWLIEEQHVGAATQHLGQMDAVTFAEKNWVLLQISQPALSTSHSPADAAVAITCPPGMRQWTRAFIPPGPQRQPDNLPSPL